MKSGLQKASTQVRYPESSTQSQASPTPEEQNRISLVSTRKVGVASQFCMRAHALETPYKISAYAPDNLQSVVSVHACELVYKP